jgi:uncharacterized membrane protein YeaQ/YmgE (transglycosylase-associated protein family)
MFRTLIGLTLVLCLAAVTAYGQANAPATRPSTSPVENVRAAAEEVTARTAGTVQQIREQGLTFEVIVALIVVGGFLGMFIGIITFNNRGFGLFLNLVIGGIGAFIGGVSVRVLGLDFGWPRISFATEALMMAVIFSIVLVVAYRVITKKVGKASKAIIGSAPAGTGHK